MNMYTTERFHNLLAPVAAVKFPSRQLAYLAFHIVIVFCARLEQRAHCLDQVPSNDVTALHAFLCGELFAKRSPHLFQQRRFPRFSSTCKSAAAKKHVQRSPWSVPRALAHAK
jgi:hypothetical protein